VALFVPHQHHFNATSALGQIFKIFSAFKEILFKKIYVYILNGMYLHSGVAKNELVTALPRVKFFLMDCSQLSHH